MLASALAGCTGTIPNLDTASPTQISLGAGSLTDRRHGRLIGETGFAAGCASCAAGSPTGKPGSLAEQRRRRTNVGVFLRASRSEVVHVRLPFQFVLALARPAR